MITDSQKVDLRRMMWYPIFGSANTQAYGFRYMSQYGLMEYRFINMSAEEEMALLVLLNQCLALEIKLAAVSDDLDTSKAGPWTRNSKQLRENNSLLTLWRKKLCEYIGILPGPMHSMGGNKRITV